ncbi:MAG: hypothetical protein LBR76_00985, partial [Oscillospiraceae bacterium]|nr:hypothetical protein [Oscillospiraceae bacterium]
MKMRIMPKKTSKILSLALALALLAFYVPANVTASAEADHPFEGGDGWTTPYGISTVAQLAAMGDYPNTSFILLNDITVSTYSGGKNGVVETLEGVEFDGNGYTISGIRSYQGLFAETEGSTIIKNLNVAASITNSGEDHVGAIVGYAHDYLQIINCHGSGTVRSDTGYGVGGLVGSMYGSDVLDIIQSSFNGTVQGQYEVGGLVGKTDYAYIYQCRTSGSVTAIGGSTRYGNDAGGLVGDFQGTMQQCFSSATIVGETNVGGLVGTFGPGANRPVMVKDSYSTGRVTGYGTNVGGIAGHMQPTAGDADIDNCYSTSTLTGNANVGGIVGNSGSRSWVTDCYAINTSLTITSRNSMFGRVTGEASALCSNIYGKTNLRMSNTDGDTVGNGHDGDDMSLTQLQSQSSYYGWNFSSIWKMNPYYSSYPTLQWQEENQQSVALNETAITIRV